MNFFIKICTGKTVVSRKFTRETKKNISSITHIFRRAHRPMSVERSTSVCRPLHTLGATSRDDLINRSLWRFTTGSASCKEGSSVAIISAEGVVAASLFGSSLSLQRKQMAKTSHKSKERKQVQSKISS
jgi:hypothetical protein